MKPPLPVILLLIILLIFAVFTPGCEETSPKKKKVPKKVVQKTLFQSMPASYTGVNFNNKLPETPELNVLSYQYYYNGAGLAVGDIDNDGLADLFFTGNLIYPKLYLNKGDFKFEDVTQKGGIKTHQGWKTGTSMVDINGDGYLDIYICFSGKLTPKERENQLFINNGDGSFTDQAEAYGLNDPGYSSHAAFIDYDRDGDLDMYLLNHQISHTPTLNMSIERLRNEISPFVGDKLFRNEGPGKKFTDVSREAGIISNHIGYGLGVAVGDVNRDGWPDLYVSNDFLEPDYLYINQKNGTFKEELKQQVAHTPYFSMGNDMADINNDGWLDIMTTDMMPESNFRQKTTMASMRPETFERRIREGFHYQYMFNALQVNSGLWPSTGTFFDIGMMAGVSKTDWSWAPLFADFDNDGWQDLFVSNGVRKDPNNNDFRIEKERRVQTGQPLKSIIQDLLPSLQGQKIPNNIYKNQGDLTFTKVINEWGLTDVGYSIGAAYADLDNDGDLDIVVNNVDGPAFIHQNHAEELLKENHYLKIKFEGSPENPFGIGASVTLKTGDRQWYREHYTSRGYLSTVAPGLHIGLGNTATVETLTVTWSDGKSQVLQNVKADQELVLLKTEATSDSPAQADRPPSFFTEGPDLKWSHEENTFDDYKREVLLPHKMSTLGPALATGDVNGDGLDDIYAGGAKDQPGIIFIQASNGSFSGKNAPYRSEDRKCEDTGATFFDADGDGDLDLYVVSGGNEMAENDPWMQDRLYLNDGAGIFTKAKDALPAMPTSGGCVAAHDFDGDGDQDLFVGGRQVPGKYPFPPRSYLLRNDGGKFTDITEEAGKAFRKVGMVTSAVWADVNGDKKVDLVLAGEWMPVSIFLQESGQFMDNTQAAGLIHATGWWYSLVAEDMDKDGDLDLVAGNLGLNYKYKATPEKPFRVYGGDFDKNGHNDIVLAYNEGATTYPLRGRECSSQQIPDIKKKFPNYQSFGNATLFDVYGIENLNQGIQYKAETFASTYFENTGDGTFVPHPLPNQAQVSSVNGIIPIDCNGDGHLDIVIAGNHYDAEIETPRADAGIGLVLLGDGKGNFKPVSAQEGGFFAPGNVKVLAPVGMKDGFGIVVGRNDEKISLKMTKSAEN